MTRKLVGALSLVGLAVLSVAQQAPPREEEGTGFFGWPTQRQIELVIDRICDGVAEQYDMDDEQLDQTRALFKEKFPAFMQQNRQQMHRLINEFFTVQMDEVAPTPEDVADWAQRALPLLNQFKDLVHATTDDMRSYLTEDQQVKLEGELAAFDTGLTFATNKVKTWADGNYDPETEWTRPGRDRDQRARTEKKKIEAEQERARQEAMVAAGGQPAEAASGTASTGDPKAQQPSKSASKPASKIKDEWEKYVEDFCKRYSFDSDQTQKAYTLLKNAQTDRDEYLRKHAADMEKVASLQKNAKSPEERESAKTEFERVNKPVERKFTQLKEKLDNLPTRKQRQEAAKAQLSKAGETGPPEKSGKNTEKPEPAKTP